MLWMFLCEPEKDPSLLILLCDCSNSTHRPVWSVCLPLWHLGGYNSRTSDTINPVSQGAQCLRLCPSNQARSKSKDTRSKVLRFISLRNDSSSLFTWQNPGPCCHNFPSQFCNLMISGIPLSHIGPFVSVKNSAAKIAYLSFRSDHVTSSVQTS